ncbi:helix-turn-helix domain-containing protein [Gemmiger sp.]
MADKKKWVPSKMFLQWCLSYLLISVIALMLILASGYRYIDVLRDNLEYTNGIQLDMTRVWLDQKVRVLRNITAKESSSAAIDAVRQADDYDDIARYDYYLLTRKVSADVINYSIGDAYFLYFPSTDAIVSNTKYGQSRRFYDLVLDTYGIEYDDWMEMLSQNLVTTRVFRPAVQGDDGKNYLVLMRPLNITSRDPDKAVAVMIVDLEDLFKASDWLNNDTLCIVDRNNGALVSNRDLSDETSSAIMELIRSNGSRKFDNAAHTTTKGEYISIISSDYENWDVAVILKEQAFASKIIDMQKLLAVIVVIYLLLSLVVIYNSITKRYVKLRNILKALPKENTDDPAKDLASAYAYIDSRVQKLVQDNVESSDVIERQRTAMLCEQFHILVTNADAAAEIDTERLERLDFPLHKAKRFYLLAYRLQKQDMTGEKDPDKMVEMQWFILQNVTRETLANRELENRCFREGGTQVYVIWSEKDDPRIVESILWSYEYCRSFLAQHFEFRYDIAVSGEHTGLDGVYKAYREICRVYQYQQRTQDTGTIFYSDLKLKPGDTTIRYPVEAENKLHLAVHSGDETAACDGIRELMRQNRESYLSPAAMQFLVGKIMSTIVNAGVQQADDPELAESQNRVMETARRDDPAAMEEALCRLAATVCQAVRATEQEAQEDEKGRLYLQIRDYIEANYSDAGLNVNAISEHFDRPAPFVSRYFKEMSGTNLTQYIHKARLEHVKEKLLQGEKLETIALTCGFGSLRSFLRIFKQYEGVTPSQYRELHGKREETTNENI